MLDLSSWPPLLVVIALAALTIGTVAYARFIRRRALLRPTMRRLTAMRSVLAPWPKGAASSHR